MLILLFVVILSEVMVILSLTFKNPVRKILIGGLDRFKRGKGPIIVKTVALTVLTVLSSSIYSIFKIQKRWIQDGNVNPTDQVVMSKHILEASLMAFFLFLALLTDKLHHYMRELHVTRETVEAVQNDKAKFGPDDIMAREEQVGSFKDIVRQLQAELDDKAKEAGSFNDSIKKLKSELENKNKEAGSFKDTVNQLQSELENKTKEMNTAQAKVEALQKQLEGLLVEYDRLLAENQELRGRVVSS